MRFPSTRPAPATLATGAALCAALCGPAWSQASTQPAPPAQATPNHAAAPLPARNADAEQALERHFRSLYWTLEGQRSAPDSSQFTDNFNRQITTDQLQQVLAQAHQNLGNCRLAGTVKTPISSVGRYLLQCSKGYVPLDIAVEATAPYRVHSLMLHPPYSLAPQ